jgi:YtkA-like protein
MVRRLGAVVLGLAVLGAGLHLARAAELKPVHTQKTKDVVVRLRSESGQWKQGKNAFVLELVSANDNTPVDAGKVTLSTSMAMPGMAPMIAGAKLTPDQTRGRYVGTIEFSDRGTREVTVRWDGPAGKGSTKFSVPVR